MKIDSDDAKLRRIERKISKIMQYSKYSLYLFQEILMIKNENELYFEKY